MFSGVQDIGLVLKRMKGWGRQCFDHYSEFCGRTIEDNRIFYYKI